MSVREHPRDDALLREVLVLRARVAELQRAAARYEETSEISLAEREELLGEAERLAHLGTWTWDFRSGRVTWSEEMFRILGIEPGSITPSAETFFSRIHPDDRERTRAAEQQGRAEGVLPLVDCRIVRSDGSIRHTTSSASYLFDNDGTPRRMVGGVLDRTQSLEAEVRLRRALGLLEEAQALARLGNWRFVPSTGELEWSHEFRRIAGFPEDAEATVEGFLERLVPEDRARFQAGYEHVLDGPIVSTETDARLRRPDGEIRHLRFRGTIVEAAGCPLELRGTMLDITDQVRMREDLVRSQKMEAIGRLAAGIAHDFNNLLTVVVGNLALLADRVGDSEELSDSLQALDSAANLTSRLLAFGRKAQLAPKHVDLNELVRTTSNLLRRLVGDHVLLHLDLAPGLPEVYVDEVGIERILVNLVVNARDAMPGGGTVTISTVDRRNDSVPHVAFSVADEGPGILPTELPHIFEPFYSTRKSSHATGLGLATVLGTAEQHGGTVEVGTTEGGGAVFTVILPTNASTELGNHAPR